MTIAFHEILLEDAPMGKIVTLKFKETLRKKDYEEFVPKIEGLMADGSKIRLLVELIEFKGWTAGALWEDTKFAARHFNDLKKIKTSGPLESKSCERMITPSPFGSANAGSLSPFFNALSPIPDFRRSSVTRCITATVSFGNLDSNSIFRALNFSFRSIYKPPQRKHWDNFTHA